MYNVLSYHATERTHTLILTHQFKKKRKEKKNKVKISDAFEGGLYIFKSGCLP